MRLYRTSMYLSLMEFSNRTFEMMKLNEIAIRQTAVIMVVYYEHYHLSEKTECHHGSDSAAGTKPHFKHNAALFFFFSTN